VPELFSSRNGKSAGFATWGVSWVAGMRRAAASHIEQF
jgi:hypothetical protein